MLLRRRLMGLHIRTLLVWHRLRMHVWILMSLWLLWPLLVRHLFLLLRRLLLMLLIGHLLCLLRLILKRRLLCRLLGLLLLRHLPSLTRLHTRLLRKSPRYRRQCRRARLVILRHVRLRVPVVERRAVH